MHKIGSAAFAAMLGSLALSGCGQGHDVDAGNAATAIPASTTGTRLASAFNGSWITLSGRVVVAGRDRFELDYGSGRVTVEMDDWDWYHEGRALLPGDEVTVTGRVDRDFAEHKTIEAGSVYVKNLGTTFYANPGDEEDVSNVVVSVPANPGFVGLTGIVSNIDGRRFILDEPDANILVDTSAIADNPLDDVGKFQVKAGDRVQVWGRLISNPKQPLTFNAEGIIIQAKDATKKAGTAAPSPGPGQPAQPDVNAADATNDAEPQGL